VVCDTIIDSGAGSVYLDINVARELIKQKEVKIIGVTPCNVRLANGYVEQVKLKARFVLCIDNNQMEMEAFLINLPVLSLLILGPKKGQKD
jgi:hypothetical protein